MGKKMLNNLYVLKMSLFITFYKHRRFIHVLMYNKKEFNFTKICRKQKVNDSRPVGAACVLNKRKTYETSFMSARTYS